MKKILFLILAICMLTACAAPEQTEAQISVGAALTSQESSESEPPPAPPESLPEPESSETEPETATEPSESLPPVEPKMELSADYALPGAYVTLRAWGASEPFEFTDMFGESRTMVEQEDGSLLALIPVRASCIPGDYLFDIQGGGLSCSGRLTVKQRDFERQTITVKDEVVSSTINSQEANNEFYNEINHLKYEYEDHQLWEGAFELPLHTEYLLSSSFGLVRTYLYSNGSTSDRHMGLDMATHAGTAVYAANSGKVLYAGYLQLTGNTVLIEHGYGLKTWYYHMEELLVSQGENVVKGQQIGTVGSTGFSTGPHLHFAASINHINIDPNILLDNKENILLEKEQVEK